MAHTVVTVTFQVCLLQDRHLVAKLQWQQVADPVSGPLPGVTPSLAWLHRPFKSGWEKDSEQVTADQLCFVEELGGGRNDVP